MKTCSHSRHKCLFNDTLGASIKNGVKKKKGECIYVFMCDEHTCNDSCAFICSHKAGVLHCVFESTNAKQQQQQQQQNQSIRRK